MVFLGAYFGYRKPVEPYPVVTSNIPRQVRETLLFFLIFGTGEETRNAVGGPRQLLRYVFARVLVFRRIVLFNPIRINSRF